jgi:hypothetical protein
MVARVVALCCTVLSAAVPSQAFMYQPKEGQIWDPSCFVFQNVTYCYSMYSEEEDASFYGYGSLATSLDGVHFDDRGPIDQEAPGVQWYKCFVRLLSAGNATSPPLFVMDHGMGGGSNDGSQDPDDRGCPFDGQCLRFLSSTNLLNWTYMYTMHPDPRWYNTGGRFDHMYIDAVGAEAGGGYVGFPVANPLGSPAPGTMTSPDGLNWTVGLPLAIEWGGITPAGFEVGGVEYIGGRWWLIGGGVAYGIGGYSMYVLRGGTDASAPTGEPFEPVPGGYRLSGTTRGWCITALAAFARNYDGGPTLVSNYMTLSLVNSGRANVWMLPMRLPAVTPKGTLALHWWPGNAALADGPPLPDVPPAAAVPSAPYAVVWLGEFNHSTGAVIEAVLLPATSPGGLLPGAAAGVAFEDLPPDTGPDVGFDRPGNDVKCFPMAAYASCADACEADAACAAWVWVAGPQVGPPQPYACSGGTPLSRPYCTMKNPLPAAKVAAPDCVTGLPSRSTGGNTTTALLMSLVPAGNSSSGGGGGATTLIGTLTPAAGTDAPTFSVVDESGNFTCGPGGATCADATLTALDPALPHALRVYFRRGMFELYVDDRLVQTYRYGGASDAGFADGGGRVGFIANNASAAWVNVTVHALTLG